MVHTASLPSTLSRVEKRKEWDWMGKERVKLLKKSCVIITVKFRMVVTSRRMSR